MRIFIKGILAIILATTLVPSASAKPKLRNVEVVANVAGAEVLFQKANSNKILKNCVTPCQVSLDTSRQFWILVTHEDYSFKLLSSAEAAEIDGKMVFDFEMPTVKDKPKKLKETVEACRERNMAIEDHDPEPCKRTPPIIPHTASRSGFCYAMFDITAQGTLENVETAFCSEGKFSKPTIIALQRWDYAPKMVSGVAQESPRVMTRITFNLWNSRGKWQPFRPFK